MGLLINIVGKPKTGKTVSACTFPKPLFLIDFDKGFESVRHTKKPDGTLLIPDWKDITVFSFYKKQSVALEFRNWKQQKGGSIGPAPAYAKEAMPVIEKYNSIMAELAIDQCVTLDGKKFGPFKTVVIDPLTTMFSIWSDGLLSTNSIPDLRIGDYLTLAGVLEKQFIPNLKSLMDTIPYIICIDHEDTDQSTDGAVVGEFPAGPTKRLGKDLSRHFDEVWRMEMAQDRQYTWRTRNHGLFRGAGSRFDLIDPIKPATFAELSKHLK